MRPAASLASWLAGAACAALGAAAPIGAEAQDAACEHVMTSVINNGCQVIEYGICDDGERRAELFRWTTADSVVVADADLDLRSFPPLGGDNAATSSPVLAVERAFSLDELLATGRSAGRYAIRYNYREPMTGGLGWEAELTGQRATMSGETFLAATLRMIFDDPHPEFGAARYGAEVEEYHALIDPKRRLMIFGPSVEGSEAPVVDVILPGEPGFEAEERSYNCPIH